MSEEVLRKVRRVLLYIALLMIAFVLSYIIAYPLGYSPLGYEGIEVKEDKLVLQSYNVLGLEKNRIIYEPPKGKEWKVELLKDLVNQQQTQYLFFFSPIMLALFWGGFDLLRKKSLKRVLFQGFLYAFVPGVSLIRHLNDIKDILQNSA
ncbi:hypothetical protein GLW07_09090 [Bacillus hwajinpoensis]|uniref:Uncharacterized protein n=1 Tax=Guptibacillus hwajinpoensis TaxID=208199 RepID=A0A845EYB9_9BACL|nr:hypothetical protein [Pseudalkalibacillus hwajinpoensis]MYL63506.1 hypothetical protein [Pseudalkalibacillus hwajinpoensis]